MQEDVRAKVGFRCILAFLDDKSFFNIYKYKIRRYDLKVASEIYASAAFEAGEAETAAAIFYQGQAKIT